MGRTESWNKSGHLTSTLSVLYKGLTSSRLVRSAQVKGWLFGAPQGGLVAQGRRRGEQCPLSYEAARGLDQRSIHILARAAPRPFVRYCKCNIAAVAAGTVRVNWPREGAGKGAKLPLQVPLSWMPAPPSVTPLVTATSPFGAARNMTRPLV